ncbi:MAG: Lrp/AsnC ligand binding domain-containing protein [Nitrosopumilus sp.]|nr:Lrp/AsnC ligand binding domain-containing protein [Nitrosopumilus sp.]
MLINYNMGFEEHVIDELKRIESVKEIQGVFGMFDVLVKIESSEVKTLDQTVLMKIQKIKHIQLIQTLIVYEQE